MQGRGGHVCIPVVKKASADVLDPLWRVSMPQQEPCQSLHTGNLWEHLAEGSAAALISLHQTQDIREVTWPQT